MIALLMISILISMAKLLYIDNIPRPVIFLLVLMGGVMGDLVLIILMGR